MRNRYQNKAIMQVNTITSKMLVNFSNFVSFSFCRYQKCCLLGMEAKLVMSKMEIEDKRNGQKAKRSKEATVISDSTDELIEVIDLSNEVKLAWDTKNTGQV